MAQFQAQTEWDMRDFVIEDRYPKRSRKNKIEDLRLIDEPEYFINKAEKLCKLPYPIEEIVESPEYEHDGVVCTLPIDEFTSEYIKRTGLDSPLIFDVPPEQLGMRMPNPNEFGVMDVLDCIGGDRKIEVVEVYEQKGTYMLLKEFINYYNTESSLRTKLLNVLSLEFTSTKLAEKVSAPAFVSDIDWIDNVWPKELFKRQENLLQQSSWARNNDFSTYPKVQRYCLMSVAHCFTDFHIDFGGTSVWYHILKGEKIFWLIEPTEENLKLYEEWILGGSENSCFFGKFVNRCARVKLRHGHTLIIPSGWIHCVYTPVDSLVFGGNFLHSYSIPMQIRVSRSEDRIKIGSKYRFPHFKQMFWCYMAKIIRNATHRIYQKKLPEEAHFHSPQMTQLDSQEDQNNEDKKTSISEAEELYPRNIATICYDHSLGNAADGSFTYNPIQSIYEQKNGEKFIPSEFYDLDYLRSLSWLEINGLFFLFEYAKKLVKSKQPEVIEGITRPNHLVKELQALIAKITELDLLNFQADFHLSPNIKAICGEVEHLISEHKGTSISFTVKMPHNNGKKKMKRQAMASEIIQKKTAKKKIVQPAVLVDGLPLATHLNQLYNPISGGFNPAGEVVKLGQRPMQSAWRKSSHMAKPPPPTHIQQFKKRIDITPNERESGHSLLPTKADGSATDSTECMDITLAQQQQPTPTYLGKERKSSQRIQNSLPRSCAHKFLEIHDSSPEFAHRSPLQRIKEPATSSQTNSTPFPNCASMDRSEAKRHFQRGGNVFGNSAHNPSFNNSGFGQNNNCHFRGAHREGNQRSWNQRNPTFKNSRRWSTEDKSETSIEPPYEPSNVGGNQSFDNSSFYQSTSDTKTSNGITPTFSNQHQCEKSERQGPNRESEALMFEEQRLSNANSVRNSAIQPSTLPPPPPPQQFRAEPMETAVNELLHISQIMDASRMGYIDLDQIPLPTEPAVVSASQCELTTTPVQTVDDPTQQLFCATIGVDPFADVDQLAHITEMMRQDGMG